MGHDKRANGDDLMPAEYRWLALIACFVLMMYLICIAGYEKACVDIGYQNSVNQGCVTGIETRLFMFSMASLFFLTAIIIEIAMEAKA
jgi:uncharacterized membrane protein (DUF485 family)